MEICLWLGSLQESCSGAAGWSCSRSVWGRRFGQNEQTLGGDKAQGAFLLLLCASFPPSLPMSVCLQRREMLHIRRENFRLQALRNQRREGEQKGGRQGGKREDGGRRMKKKKGERRKRREKVEA